MGSTLARVRRSALALTTLALAATPASALAQSASDDVYQDPFANQGQQSGTAGARGSGSGSQGSSASSAQSTPAPASSQSQAATTNSPTTGSTTSGGTTAAPQTEAAAAETATPGNELPRTGADAGLTALAGLALLLRGAVLRRRGRVD